MSRCLLAVAPHASLSVSKRDTSDRVFRTSTQQSNSDRQRGNLPNLDNMLVLRVCACLCLCLCVCWVWTGRHPAHALTHSLQYSTVSPGRA